MIHFERSIDIEATPESIWAVIGRFMHIDEFAPLITSVDALTDGEDGVGSKRRCNFKDGSSVVEEVTEWEVCRKYRVRLSEIATMPLHEMYAEISLHSLTDSVRVNWSMDYHVKYGPLGWLLGQTIMKMMMGKILNGNLKCLASKVNGQK